VTLVPTDPRAVTAVTVERVVALEQGVAAPLLASTVMVATEVMPELLVMVVMALMVISQIQMVVTVVMAVIQEMLDHVALTALAALAALMALMAQRRLLVVMAVMAAQASTECGLARCLLATAVTVAMLVV
jgi:hypothetical protein